jgi:hypothetical protein
MRPGFNCCWLLAGAPIAVGSGNEQQWELTDPSVTFGGQANQAEL